MIAGSETRIIAFSARGAALASRIASGFAGARIFAPEKYISAGAEPIGAPLSEWAGESFTKAGIIIFVGSTGIAVRAIAPHVRSKTEDPAVVVVDEGGNFAISLLSGHLGGANEIASRVADLSGAVPVITTATDIHGLFAVDVFAKKNNLAISDMKLAKEISAALLAGEPVGFRSELPVSGDMPPELTAGGAEIGIYIKGIYREEKNGKPPFTRTLTLAPRRVAVGIGCRRGKGADEIAVAVLGAMSEAGVSIECLSRAASIDVKRDEAGIIEFCERESLPFATYAADELNSLGGDFSASASGFVAKTVGVDCVCERAAVMASGGGSLICRKRAGGGVTVALAVSEEGVQFG